MFVLTNYNEKEPLEIKSKNPLILHKKVENITYQSTEVESKLNFYICDSKDTLENFIPVTLYRINIITDESFKKEDYISNCCNIDKNVKNKNEVQKNSYSKTVSVLNQPSKYIQPVLPPKNENFKFYDLENLFPKEIIQHFSDLNTHLSHLEPIYLQLYHKELIKIKNADKKKQECIEKIKKPKIEKFECIFTPETLKVHILILDCLHKLLTMEYHRKDLIIKNFPKKFNFFISYIQEFISNNRLIGLNKDKFCVIYYILFLKVNNFVSNLKEMPFYDNKEKKVIEMLRIIGCIVKNNEVKMCREPIYEVTRRDRKRI
ncbi:hypothetical protein CWI37_1285p0010 [Hamiltosporidium tvaerminnensis]|uniref:Uncharacterized protein n=1 Tax=Hamiltosporidium tvaerminnensis TaxID=1176355 RepID=A0A4V2JUB9_9MICR|nr:hypothetical protein CWI37_1285p0010 [Hamiltosporidium tvaerminnensis]